MSAPNHYPLTLTGIVIIHACGAAALAWIGPQLAALGVLLLSIVTLVGVLSMDAKATQLALTQAKALATLRSGGKRPEAPKRAAPAKAP